jgi:hypothetical protein
VAKSSVSMLLSSGDLLPVMAWVSSADHSPIDFSFRESFSCSSSVPISLISESSSLLPGVSLAVVVAVVRDLKIIFTAVLAGGSGDSAVLALSHDPSVFCAVVVLVVAVGVAVASGTALASGMSMVLSVPRGFRPIFLAAGTALDNGVDVVESMESVDFVQTK